MVLVSFFVGVLEQINHVTGLRGSGSPSAEARSNALTIQHFQKLVLGLLWSEFIDRASNMLLAVIFIVAV